MTTGIDLRVPIASPKDYRLAGTFDLEGARLGLRGVDFGLTALDGIVRLDTDRLAADQLTGRFLDEPVTIALRAATADETGLTQVADVQGETPAGKLAAAFSLPYAEKLAGSVAWEATVKVPARRAERARPHRDPVGPGAARQHAAAAADQGGRRSRSPCAWRCGCRNGGWSR